MWGVQGARCVPCRRVLQGCSAPRGKEPPVLPGGVWGGTSARRAFSQGIHSPANVPAVPSGVSVLQSAGGGEGQGASAGHQSFGVLWWLWGSCSGVPKARRAPSWVGTEAPGPAISLHLALRTARGARRLLKVARRNNSLESAHPWYRKPLVPAAQRFGVLLQICPA